jgi:hypothetical protein
MRSNSATTKQLPIFFHHARHIRKEIQNLSRQYPSPDQESCPPMDRQFEDSYGAFWHSGIL